MLKDGHLASRTFGIDEESAIALAEENVQLFETAVGEWLDSVPGAKGTLSRKTFVDKLIPLIRAKKINGDSFTQSEIDQFEKTISDLPLQKFRVLRRVYGVVLPSDRGPVQMGDFLIYPSR